MTQYQFTGQYSYESDFGLQFYNARFYDSNLGRFVSADSIVPPGVQGLDRYAYTFNNPVNFVDPTGHISCDQRDGCGVNGKAEESCSVEDGYFNGSFRCTPADLDATSIENRQDWFNEMLASADEGLVKEFNNINGILDAFIATDTALPGTWASWGDAGILTSIQYGLAEYFEESYIPNASPHASIATDAWLKYFKGYKLNIDRNELLRFWGAAEGAGTTFGRSMAVERGLVKTRGEILFLAAGDWYRNELKDRTDPLTIDMTTMGAQVYDWLFDTSSTIGVPGTNIDTGIPPVEVVAFVLLQIK